MYRIDFQRENNYFGRNLDLERSYGEGVVVTPQNFSFNFRFIENIKNHSAIIGIPAV